MIQGTSMEWLEAMPHIPLARGVPVVYADPDEKGLILEAVSDVHAVIWFAGEAELRTLDDWFVDLSDPQGFAYALRRFAHLAAIDRRRERFEGWGNYGSRVVWQRHMAGETTDEDRFELANGLRLYSAPREQRQYHKDASWCIEGDPCQRAHLMRMAED